MFWRSFVRVGIALVFVSVPALALAVLWPGGSNVKSAASASSVAVMPAAEKSEVAKPRDAANQDLDAVTLLNHWEYTARDLPAFDRYGSRNPTSLFSTSPAARRGSGSTSSPVLGLLTARRGGHFGPSPVTPVNSLSPTQPQVIALILEFDAVLIELDQILLSLESLL
jgi:hypothetical protein